MATDSSNEIVLSYYDCLLRASDVELLQGSHWLNDVIIGFYFEYLDETCNKTGNKDFYFVSPELTQLLKMSEPNQYIIFLDPFSISECKCILFPLNNCDKKDAAGGTHWSLLIFCKGDKTCYHFDSAKGYNGSIASQFAENVMSCVFDKNEPNKKFVEVDSPQQDNGYDCGVYVLCLADVITNHILKNEKIDGCDYDQDVPRSVSSIAPLIIVSESCEHGVYLEDRKDPNCLHKLQQNTIILEEFEDNEFLKKECVEETTKKTFLEALIIFFDLDLLRDFVYVNITLSITFVHFAELNFSLLTPFILSERGFSKIEIAIAMSIFASFDVVTRLTIPFIVDFIGWQNRTFFLVGICGMTTGRIVLAHVQNFAVTLAVAVVIGVGKVLRTIFMALAIPSHVPLSSLTSATGIQLLTSGIVSLTLGPIVGWIGDVTSNYAIMLHVLNIFTYLTAISWWLEICFTERKSTRAEEEKDIK